MADRQRRQAERRALGGGPEDEMRVARLTCREDGHLVRKDIFVGSPPTVVPATSARVSLCWRCHEILSFEDATWRPPLSIDSERGTVRTAAEEFTARNGMHFQFFTLSYRDVLPNSVRVAVDEKVGKGLVYWEQLDTLILSNPRGQHYVVRISDRNNHNPLGPSARIEFGDNVCGRIPMGFARIAVTYEYLEPPVNPESPELSRPWSLLPRSERASTRDQDRG